MRIRHLAAFLLPLALAGCDRAAPPTQPESTALLSAQALAPMASPSSLDALWPNEDGRRWDYLYVFAPGHGPGLTFYATADEVPSAPAPSELVRLLPGDRRGRPLRGFPGTPTAIAVTTGTYRLYFDGEITTLSGATGQNLVETFEEASGAATHARIEARPERNLLTRLAMARPDLRARLSQLGITESQSDFQPPLLLHGGAWEKTASYIGAYGDVDRLLAWKYLDADLKPGATFDLQLVPSLATDVYLHGLIVKNKDALRGLGGSREVEVVYVIDYGVSQATGSSGEPQGYFRWIGYGSVTYAPNVGPVHLTERVLAEVEDPTRFYGQIDLSLTQVTPGGGAVAGR